MNLKEISSEDILIDKVKGLYEAAFPADERRNFADFVRLMDDKRAPFHVSVMEDSGDFIGLLTSWEWEDLRYFEHFAVCPEKRNGGIGAKALELALKRKPTPVILEVEPPADELTRRRVGFYERNGFRLWRDLHYVQPAYGEGRNPMELCLMTYGEIVFSGEDDERILRIKRAVYGFAE